MDGSRDLDLAELHKVREDPSRPPDQRRRADRTMSRIKQQMADPFIKRERQRLIAASRASDVIEVEKISAKLTAYQHRHEKR